MNKKSENTHEKSKPSKPDWDWVDEAGWESFPASDPPAIHADLDAKPDAAAKSKLT